MRPTHCTISPSFVRSVARKTLAGVLPWKAYGRLVTVVRLLSVLLAVAASRRSLSAIVAGRSFGFGRETARKAVDANLPDLATLVAGLNDALFTFASRARRRRRLDIAIDLHYRPFYGKHDTPGIVGGQKKEGTNYFFAYATAVLIHPRYRYTLALVPVNGSQKPHEIVAQLLGIIESHRLRLRGVTLDSGFDSADTILLLQERGLSYAVPLRRKGKGSNSRNDWFDQPAGTIANRSWKSEASPRRVVQTLTVVRVRSRDCRVQLLAFGGRGGGDSDAALHRRAGLACRKYAARYGIESSYRQMNQGRGTTTKDDERYRFLLIGMALLLRQVWVWLSGQVAKARGLADAAWVSELPLMEMLEWLADALKRSYPPTRGIDLGRPITPLDSK